MSRAETHEETFESDQLEKELQELEPVADSVLGSSSRKRALSGASGTGTGGDSEEEDDDDDDEREGILGGGQHVTKGKGPGVFGPKAADIWVVAKRKQSQRVGKTHGKKLPREVAHALGEAHALYIQGGDSVARSIEAFSAVTKLAPRLPDPYLAMAMIYEEAGHFMEALQLFIIAAVNTPKSSELWRRIAFLAVDLQQYEQALAAIDYINRYDKNPLDGLSQKVFICLKLREDAKALITVKVLLAKYPLEYYFLLEYGERCETAGFPQRARYAYMRFCLTCVAHHVPGGVSPEILARYHCRESRPASSGASRQQGRSMSVVVAPAMGDVDVPSLFYACSKAVKILLNINCDHSLLTTTIIENIGNAPSHALTLTDLGTHSKNVEAAYCILTACVDFMAALNRSLPVDSSDRPSVPLDIGLCLVLCILYKSVAAASAAAASSNSINENTLDSPVPVPVSAPSSLTDPVVYEQDAAALISPPAHTPTPITVEAGRQEFLQAMAMLTPLLWQLRGKGIVMDASAVVSSSSNTSCDISTVSASPLQSPDLADPGLELRAICIPIISVIGRMGMMSLAKRYADGILRSVEVEGAPQQQHEYMNESNTTPPDPAISYGFLSAAVQSYTMVELSIAYFCAGSYDEAFNACLSALSSSTNDISSLRLLSFLAQKVSGDTMSVGSAIKLAQKCTAMHFDALRTMFSAVCPFGEFLTIVDDARMGIGESSEVGQVPGADQLSVGSIAASLTETFYRLLDPTSGGEEGAEGGRGRPPDTYFLYSRRVESELKVMLRWAEELLLDGEDTIGYLVVVLPLINMWLSSGDFCHMDVNAAGRCLLRMHQCELFTPSQHQLGVTVVAMMLYVHSRSPVKLQSLHSTITDHFGVLSLSRFAVISAACLWQLNTENSAVSILEKTFNHTGLTSRGNFIPSDLLKVAVDRMKCIRDDETVWPAVTAVLEDIHTPEDVGARSSTTGVVRTSAGGGRRVETTRSKKRSRKRQEVEAVAFSPPTTTVDNKLKLRCSLGQNNTELGHALLVLLAEPASIWASNRVTRLIFGDLYSKLLQDGISVFNVESEVSIVPVAAVDEISLEQLLSVRTFFSSNKLSIPAVMMSAHDLQMQKKHAEALDRYILAFSLDDKQPLTVLCIAVYLIYLSTRPVLSKVRHETFSKGMAFFSLYMRLRLDCSVESPFHNSAPADDSETISNPTTLDSASFSLCLQQEIAYNTGRLFHEIDQLHLAQEYYYKVLAIADENNNHVTGGGGENTRFDYTREAAFNLIRIFSSNDKSSGGVNIAINIMQKYLSIDD